MSRSLKVRYDRLKAVKLAVKHHSPNQKTFANQVGLALSTVSNFLNGKPVDVRIFQEICQKLALDWQEVAEDNNISSNAVRYDWGEAIDVSVFYGRTQEFTKLKQWIERDRASLIAILGMGGIGKTALSIKLAE